MKRATPFLAIFVGFLLAASTSLADADLIKDLESRYDYVGVVTHTSVKKWNTSGTYRMSPVDPEKVPGGKIYVGIVKDGDPEFPYFCDIYIKGTIWGYNEIFVRVHKTEGSSLVAFDDNSNDFKISIFKKGRGYKRRN